MNNYVIGKEYKINEKGLYANRNTIKCNDDGQGEL
jgi:hypothetical protein